MSTDLQAANDDLASPDTQDNLVPGIVVDHLDGVVGEAEIEKAEQQCLADDRAVNASKTNGAYDDMRDRFALQQELNRGGRT